MKRRRGDLSLWLGVLAGFGLLLGAWTLLFVIAARHPVEAVPLEHRAQP